MAIRRRANSESKDRVIPSTCGRDQPDERRSTVCQYNVGASAAGITINQAVDTTAKVMDNALPKRGCPLHAGRDRTGTQPGGMSAGKEIFPADDGRYVFRRRRKPVNSRETLDNVADYYTNEADYRIQRLLALLEPTMLVVLADFAGIIVVSIYLPIFTMYDLM